MPLDIQSSFSIFNAFQISQKAIVTREHTESKLNGVREIAGNVLVTNILDENELSNKELLVTYKNQNNLELINGLLKDPAYLAWDMSGSRTRKESRDWPVFSSCNYCGYLPTISRQESTQGK